MVWKPIARLSLITLLGLSFAGGGAYFAAPQVAEWAGEYLLGSQGATDVRIDMTSVGLFGARIERLRFTWDETQVDIGAVDIHYRPASLVRRRLDRIRIGTGRVAFAGTGPAAPTVPPSPLPRVPLLPFDSLVVEGISAELPGMPALDLSGELVSENDELEGRLFVRSGERGRWRLDGRWRPQRLDLRFSGPGANGRPWGRLHLARDGEGTDISAAFEPSATELRTLLAAWARLPSRWEGDGHARFEGRLAERVLKGDYRLGFALADGGRSARGELSGSVKLRERRAEVAVATGSVVEVRSEAREVVVSAPEGWVGAVERFGGGKTSLFGKGALTATLKGSAPGLSGRATVTDPTLTFGTETAVTARLAVEGRVQGTGQAAPAAFFADGKVRWDREGAAWRVGDKARITLPAPYPAAEGKGPQLVLENSPTVRWRPGGGWQMAPSRWRLVAPAFAGEKLQAVLHGARLTVDSLAGQRLAWSAAGKVVARVEGAINGGALPPLDLNGSFSATGGKVAFSGEATGAGDGLRLVFSGAHRPKAGSGSAHWQLDPVTFTPETGAFSDLYRAPGLPLDLGSGTVSAEGRLRWVTPPGSRAGITADLDITADDLGGFYGDLLFSGASARFWLGLDADGTLHTRQPAPITVNRLTAGFPARNLVARLGVTLASSRPPVIVIERPSVQAFGGTVRGEAIRIDFGAPLNRFDIEVAQLALDELLSLEQAPIEGFGRISGRLPIRLDRDGVAIDDGRLAATDSGVIRYRPGEEGETLAQSDRNMRLAVEALRDFRYDHLEATADYAPGGQLDLAVRLEGNNPNLFRGRTVRFNINVEQNVPELLRSLRAARAMEGQVEAWVEAFYRQRRNATGSP